VPTAQEQFAELIRKHVAPALRQLGFKGSGQVYVLPDDAAWILVGFQRSVSSNRARIRFTINLTVANKQKWADLRAQSKDWSDPYPERPAPSTFYGKGIWQRRIGDLLPRHADHWWELQPDTDLREIALDVFESVRDFGLPALRARLASGEPVEHDGGGPGLVG
jgi:hypothetical protein